MSSPPVEPRLRPADVRSGFMTATLAIGSLVHSIFLSKLSASTPNSNRPDSRFALAVWTHASKGASTVAVGHAYLDRHSHTFTRLALMLSLPAVLLLWVCALRAPTRSDER